MKTIEEHAIDLVCGGALSNAADELNDLNEYCELASTDDLRAAIKLACDIADAIRANPGVVLALVGRGEG